jgi:Flp pilus assembly protein TadB
LVAQARRRRRTKHRGNAAGVIEARGRTGRKPTAAEKGGKGAQAARAREKRLSRYDRPPTWSAAFKRSALFAALLLVLALVLKAGALQAVVYFVFALLAYTPISYYTDAWMYRRQQRKKAGTGGGKAATR